MPDTDPRWDPEMLAAMARLEARATALPPQTLTLPLDGARATGEALHSDTVAGPAMALTEDRWLPIMGRRLLCRFHRPARIADGLSDAAPVLIYLHGGGWVWNSIDTHDRLMREYAAAAGCAVIGPDYALSPEAAFPQALEETAAVVRWVAAHGADWGVDPARIVIGGDSAGGNLAAAAALLLRDTDPNLRLAGLLLNYGVFDARLDTPSYDEFADGYRLTRDKMRFYWDCYCPRPADRLNPLASPLRADLAGLPPVLLHWAALDVLSGENAAMAERLRAAGVPLEAEVFPGVAHGFLREIAEVARAREAVEKAGGWLRRVFAG